MEMHNKVWCRTYNLSIFYGRPFVGEGEVYFVLFLLLTTTGREERGVLEVGGIPVAILPSCQYMENNAL